MRNLAQRMLAMEAASKSAHGAHVPEAVRVCEKLRISLTRFAGSDGFTALLRRALALARRDCPALETVTLKPDGSLDGLDNLTDDETNGGAQAATALTVHLLELLENFIGKRLTLQLVREAWPDEALDEELSRKEAL